MDNRTLDDMELDARDMAAEIAASRGEDEVLNDIDTVLAAIAKPRTFEDVINQWTETVLAENRKTNDTDCILLLTRLGVLGQRLIYEANDLGVRQVMAETRRVLNGE